MSVFLAEQIGFETEHSVLAFILKKNEVFKNNITQNSFQKYSSLSENPFKLCGHASVAKCADFPQAVLISSLPKGLTFPCKHSNCLDFMTALPSPANPPPRRPTSNENRNEYPHSIYKVIHPCCLPYCHSE